MLKMMVGNNLKDSQLQQIVDKTIMYHDADNDGALTFDEFCDVSKMAKGTLCCRSSKTQKSTRKWCWSTSEADCLLSDDCWYAARLLISISSFAPVSHHTV